MLFYLLLASEPDSASQTPSVKALLADHKYGQVYQDITNHNADTLQLAGAFLKTDDINILKNALGDRPPFAEINLQSTDLQLAEIISLFSPAKQKCDASLAIQAVTVSIYSQLRAHQTLSIFQDIHWPAFPGLLRLSSSVNFPQKSQEMLTACLTAVHQIIQNELNKIKNLYELSLNERNFFEHLLNINVIYDDPETRPERISLQDYMTQHPPVPETQMTGSSWLPSHWLPACLSWSNPIPPRPMPRYLRYNPEWEAEIAAIYETYMPKSIDFTNLPAALGNGPKPAPYTIDTTSSPQCVFTTVPIQPPVNPGDAPASVLTNEPMEINVTVTQSEPVGLDVKDISTQPSRHTLVPILPASPRGSQVIDGVVFSEKQKEKADTYDLSGKFLTIDAWTELYRIIHDDQSIKHVILKNTTYDDLNALTPAGLGRSLRLRSTPLHTLDLSHINLPVEYLWTFLPTQDYTRIYNGFIDWVQSKWETHPPLSLEHFPRKLILTGNQGWDKYKKELDTFIASSPDIEIIW